MAQHVLGGAQHVPRWYRFTREGRLIRLFHQLKEAGVRSTPAILVRGEREAIEVLEAPSRPKGSWKLFDGRTVTTDQIYDLDTARAFAGYD